MRLHGIEVTSAMGSYRAETSIERPAQDVWAAIRVFGDLWWYPHVERCVIEGDDRTTWKEGSSLASVERLLTHDDAARTHSYVLVGFVGDPLVAHAGGRAYDVRNLIGHHSATLTVTPISAERSRVTYDVSVDDDDEMATSIGRGYGDALEHLKVLLE
jgi:hypothetical protein